ncbi:MAG TPA: hypothetical protein VGO98_00225 [Candidatus Saccharimonadales bacterium]|jgi:hypothetical protein|nr:hypothetical protein [Candidatus Saccharimonadales bacterium]
MNIEYTKNLKSIDRYVANREHERYTVEQFYERDDPAGALLAQQMQGESYVAAGYVYASALDEYGRLQPELDRSRGDNVRYYLALPKDPEINPRNMGSLRVITIPEGGSLNDLAAYRYSQGLLSPDTDVMLQDMVKHNGRESVREVCALALTKEATSLASFELLREITQAAIREKSDEKWLITFTSRAHNVFLKRYGSRVMQQVGSPVPVDVGDDRTSDDLRLVPTLIHPGQLLENILEDIKSTNSLAEKTRLSSTLVFMADGLDGDDISPVVREYTSYIKSTKRQKVAS